MTLADGDDARAREAAAAVLDYGITPVLVSAEGPAVAEGVQVLDPRDPGQAVAEVVAGLVEREARRRPMEVSERAAMSTDPLWVAAAAVRAGVADGCVAGASRPTAEVVRVALRAVGLAPHHTTLTSSFLMVLPDGRALGYGDCGVLPEPSAEQLAEIASDTADTFARLTGEEPVVAMLSFSTKGSADHPSVEVVRVATEIVRRSRPDLAVDGELQFDAAIDAGVAASKAPDSPSAGRANVLVFPNLAAGNIAYKVTERLAGAEALGPLLQGLAAPVNDLSRGCSSDDIIDITVITGVQALGAMQRSVAGGV